MAITRGGFVAVRMRSVSLVIFRFYKKSRATARLLLFRRRHAAAQDDLQGAIAVVASRPFDGHPRFQLGLATLDHRFRGDGEGANGGFLAQNSSGDRDAGVGQLGDGARKELILWRCGAFRILAAHGAQTGHGQAHTDNHPREQTHIDSLGKSNEGWVSSGLKFFHPGTVVAVSGSAGAGSATRAGKVTVNRVPFDGALSTRIVPPCAFTIQATKLRPKPSPGSAFPQVTWDGTRKKRSKMCGICSSGIPQPVSAISISMDSGEFRSATCTRPPAGVNFMELESRLDSMRSICTRSTSAGHSAGRSAESSTRAPSAGIWNCSTMSRTTELRSSRIFCNASCPDSACESNSSARTICERRSMSCRQFTVASRYCSMLLAVNRATSSCPRMAVMGVRSSCETSVENWRICWKELSRRSIMRLKVRIR